MEIIVEFLVNNYILIDIITAVLLFALIGYFVEKKRSKNSEFKLHSENKKTDNLNIEDIKISNDMALSEMINKNSNIDKNKG